MWDLLYTNVRLATMCRGPEPYGMIERGALGVAGGRVAWVGPASDLPGDPHRLARQHRDLEGRWMTPGLIDCHTHLVFGGDRAAEFELRLEGASYAEIARHGGGILATVRATRTASEDELLAEAVRRARSLVAEGVTTVEIKSGYGLALDHELKQLRVARRLADRLPLSVVTTFLGAHAVPPEFAEDRDAYLAHVLEMLPAVAESGLADAVDAFCETIAFSPEQTDRVLGTARALGFPVKLHADQLSDLGGAALAARHGALSADHLEYCSSEGVAALARAGTVAVMLPGAFYALRETRLPPICEMRNAGVPLAVASDSNPGSSPISSLLLSMNMACTLFRMTPEEALAGATREGARALGLLHDRGTLEVGKRADLAVWDIGRPAELAYRAGFNPLTFSLHAGRPAAGAGINAAVPLSSSVPTSSSP